MRWPIRLRRTAMTGLLFAPATNCSSGSSEPSEPPLLGTYVLESVDGAPLPWLSFDDPSLKEYFIADTLRITSRTTIDGVYVARRHAAGDTVGVIRIRRQSSTFRIVAPNTLVGDQAVPGDTVFVTAYGLRERSPPFQTCKSDPCIWIWRRL